MPRGDRTGPMGMGPMTGRAAGFCTGFNAPGNANPASGRGFGLGGGRGRRMGGGQGWRRMPFATGRPGWMRFSPYPAPFQNPDPAIEKQALKNQAEALQSQLNMIKQRLDEMETGTSAE